MLFFLGLFHVEQWQSPTEKPIGLYILLTALHKRCIGMIDADRNHSLTSQLLALKRGIRTAFSQSRHQAVH
jgi:hypothetical protein